MTTYPTQGDGVVYNLPRDTFEREPAQQMLGVEITFPHWISSKPASPVEKLNICTLDFPFLVDVHGHDDKKLTQLAAVDPNGFLWPEALVT